MSHLRSAKSWIVLSTLLLCLTACQQGPGNKSQGSGVEQAISDAVDVYIYGYPLVTMDMTRRQMTNVAIPDAGHAPMGQLVRMRTYPAVDYHAVTAPNADTLYTTSQNPHVIRLLMGAFVLHIPENKLRVVAPDVGGGFGSKIYHYAEEAIVTWAASKLRRPVKWTAERSESFMSDAHGRDHEAL